MKPFFSGGFPNPSQRKCERIAANVGSVDCGGGHHSPWDPNKSNATKISWWKKIILAFLKQISDNLEQSFCIWQVRPCYDALLGGSQPHGSHLVLHQVLRRWKRVHFSGLLSVGLSDVLLRILLTQFLDQIRPCPSCFNLWPPKLSEFSADLGLVLKTISGKLISAVAKRNKSLAVNLLGSSCLSSNIRS